MCSAHCFFRSPLFRLVFGLSLTAVLCAGAAAGRESERGRVLEKCQELFGAPVDRKPLLFEVSPDYVLRLRFVSGVLVELAVEPKYFYQEVRPEWKEPAVQLSLLPEHYERLLKQLAELKPLGELREAGQVGVVTGGRARFTDAYADGVLERRVWSEDGESAGIPPRIYSFRILHFYDLQGKVAEKRNLDARFFPRLTRVRIRKAWYLVSEEEAARLALRQKAKLRAAGPVD